MNLKIKKKKKTIQRTKSRLCNSLLHKNILLTVEYIKKKKKIYLNSIQVVFTYIQKDLTHIQQKPNNFLIKDDTHLQESVGCLAVRRVQKLLKKTMYKMVKRGYRKTLTLNSLDLLFM